MRSRGRQLRQGTEMKTPGKKTQAARKRRRKKSQATLVEAAIENIGSKLETNEVKGTVGDLIRLLQFKKEMQSGEPRKIEVKWIGDESSGG